MVVGRGEWICWTKKRHRMFGVGVGHTESYFTLTLFHITEFFFVISHHESFFLRVFEAAYAEKASSSFLRILSFFRLALFLLRIGVAGGL